jgi:hypothetical protein
LGCCGDLAADFLLFSFLIPLFELVEVSCGWPQATPVTLGEKVTIGSFYATLGGS